MEVSIGITLATAIAVLFSFNVTLEVNGGAERKGKGNDDKVFHFVIILLSSIGLLK